LNYLEYPDWITPEIIPGVPWLSWLRWYGLMYIVIMVITFYLFKHQVKEQKLGIEDKKIEEFFGYGLLGMLVFARIFATLIYNDDRIFYLTNPWWIIIPFNPNTGALGFAGMSYHGGLLGVIVGMIVYARVKKIDLLQWGDMLAAAFPLGYTFGRLANFINGELWGRVTDVPWGMVFPNAPHFRVSEPWVADIADRLAVPVVNGMVNLPRHPSQLYQALGEGIILWVILWLILKPLKMTKGFMMAAYLAGYGVIRFIIEYFREPDANLGFVLSFSGSDNPDHLIRSLLDFSTGQVLSFLMVVAAGILFVVFHFHKKNSLNIAAGSPEGNQEKKKKQSEG
jgi:phosphatidylglycerol:prolipoprotein diacylglycerol transferase